MTSPSLFDLPASNVSDTSLDAYAKLLPTLRPKEIAVFLALCDYCETHIDGTGGELSVVMDWPVTSIRPRLTGLEDKGWITKHPARKSRLRWELRAHPYIPAVPRSAVERARKAVI